MAYALVGSLGAVSAGASGAAVTPAWGTSENRTANNLLICWCNGSSTKTLPTTPAGWSVGAQVQAAINESSTIFYKVAAGSDAAPTIAAITGVVWQVMLGEFSGNATTTPLDQSGTAIASTGTSMTATCTAADAASGNLVVCCSGQSMTAATATLADSLNNGATVTDTTNNTTSSTHHYCFGYGVTTGHASADVDSWTSTVAGTAAALTVATFKPAAGGSAPVPYVTPVVSQAVARSLVY